jgi:hypothetical protein
VLGMQGGAEGRPMTPMDIAALFRTATPEVSDMSVPLM